MVIAVGGLVTFVLNTAVHGIAVYAAGTEPAAIDTNALQFSGAPCPPPPSINDATGRLAPFAPICAEGNRANQFQFNTPGRFLVICMFAPHFTDADMWAWVTVGAGKSE